MPVTPSLCYHGVAYPTAMPSFKANTELYLLNIYWKAKTCQCWLPTMVPLLLMVVLKYVLLYTHL
jgi:hypothetical protein